MSAQRTQKKASQRTPVLDDSAEFIAAREAANYSDSLSSTVTLRRIVQANDPTRKRRRVDQRQRQRAGEFAEDRHAVASRRRVEEEMILVDQPVLDE